jgi:hypothetical protein
VQQSRFLDQQAGNEREREHEAYTDIDQHLVPE